VGAEQEHAVTVETFPARPGRPTVQVTLTDGMTLDDLLESLKVPGDTEAVLVNGGYAKPAYRLQNGDRVIVIPFMSGG
jgi:sulfur carrier protein ThiS